MFNSYLKIQLLFKNRCLLIEKIIDLHHSTHLAQPASLLAQDLIPDHPHTLLSTVTSMDTTQCSRQGQAMAGPGYTSVDCCGSSVWAISLATASTFCCWETSTLRDRSRTGPTTRMIGKWTFPTPISPHSNWAERRMTGQRHRAHCIPPMPGNSSSCAGSLPEGTFASVVTR